MTTLCSCMGTKSKRRQTTYRQYAEETWPVPKNVDHIGLGGGVKSVPVPHPPWFVTKEIRPRPMAISVGKRVTRKDSNWINKSSMSICLTNVFICDVKKTGSGQFFIKNSSTDPRLALQPVERIPERVFCCILIEFPYKPLTSILEPVA